MRCTTDGGWSDAELPLHSRKTEIDIKEGTTNWRSAEIELLQLLSERSRTNFEKNFDIVLGWNQVYLKVKVWEIFCPTKISKCTFRITYILLAPLLLSGLESPATCPMVLRSVILLAQRAPEAVSFANHSLSFAYLGLALPQLCSHRVVREWRRTVHASCTTIDTEAFGKGQS